MADRRRIGGGVRRPGRRVRPPAPDRRIIQPPERRIIQPPERRTIQPVPPDRGIVDRSIVPDVGRRPSRPHILIIRPDDMVVLTVSWVGMSVRRSSGKADLVRQGRRPSYLIVEFPPQHLLEEAYFQEKAAEALAATQNPSNPENKPPPPPRRPRNLPHPRPRKTTPKTRSPHPSRR